MLFWSNEPCKLVIRAKYLSKMCTVWENSKRYKLWHEHRLFLIRGVICFSFFWNWCKQDFWQTCWQRIQTSFFTISLEIMTWENNLQIWVFLTCIVLNEWYENSCKVCVLHQTTPGDILILGPPSEYSVLPIGKFLPNLIWNSWPLRSV